RRRPWRRRQYSRVGRSSGSRYARAGSQWVVHTSTEGLPMSYSVNVRAIAFFAATSAAMACGGDRRATQVDTSAVSVGVASAPETAAPTGVLTDENVCALLDTAFSAMIATDQLAQRKTTGAVNDFASRALSEN